MSEPFLGEVRPFGFTFCPRGWAEADGQILPIAQNSALFSLYGTTYGGDGRTTFALPDLRGRAPIHFGTGPGLSSYSLGQEGGLEQVTLTDTQLPSASATVTGLTAQLQDTAVYGSFINGITATIQDPAVSGTLSGDITAALQDPAVSGTFIDGITAHLQDTAVSGSFSGITATIQDPAVSGTVSGEITAELQSNTVTGTFDNQGAHSHTALLDHSHEFSYETFEEYGSLQVVAFPVDVPPDSCAKQWSKGKCPLEEATVSNGVVMKEALGDTELTGAGHATTSNTVDMGTFSGTVNSPIVDVDTSGASVTGAVANNVLVDTSGASFTGTVNSPIVDVDTSGASFTGTVNSHIVDVDTSGASVTGAVANNVLVDTSGASFTGTVNSPIVDVDTSGASFNIAGGGQSIENRQPYLAMRYCVATLGIFPSRN